MRSSAPEGPHAPRAKQAPPSATSGATLLGPAGAQPSSPHTRSPGAPTLHKSSTQRGSAPPSSAPLPRSSATAAQSRSVTGHQRPRSSSVTSPSTPHRSSSTSPAAATKTVPSPSGKVRPSSHKTSPLPISKPSKSSILKQGSPPPKVTPSNFGEYDDQEWDVGVGHLIIDLDADIAQADKGRMSGAVPSQGSHAHQGALEDKHSLKMKIKRTKPPTKTSEAKHEIVKPDLLSSPGGLANAVPSAGSGDPSSQQQNGSSPKTDSGTAPRAIASNQRTIFKEKKRRLESMNGATPVTTAVTQLSAPNVSSSLPVQASSAQSSQSFTSSFNTLSTTTATPTSTLTQAMPSHIVNAAVKTEHKGPSVSVPNNNRAVQEVSLKTQNSPQTNSVESNSSQEQNEIIQPASKKVKLGAETGDKRDACVGTSVGTITEPDCLGPCEPGSSVTLEGIVWHETEGASASSGVLVVNVTWRGKTYVGTLLDCTKHDWAPPRFCDSPTSDLESRTPKGRAKRGRAAASASSSNTAPHTPELSVTETRSGKIRGGIVKGRRGTPTLQPPASPVKVADGNCNKRKGRDVDSSSSSSDSKGPKRSRSSSRGTPTNNGCTSPPLDQQVTSQVVTDSLQQPPLSPQLIECPEPNCNKKYKHINGLKYHQSHAHMDVIDEESRESKTDESEDTRQPSPKPVIATPADASNHDLLKPSVLRPTSHSLSPVPINGDVVPTNNQTVKTSHLYVYSNNGADPESPQKATSETVPTSGTNRVINNSPTNQTTGPIQNSDSETPVLSSQQQSSNLVAAPAVSQRQGQFPPCVSISPNRITPPVSQPNFTYNLSSIIDSDSNSKRDGNNGSFVCRPIPQATAYSSLLGSSPIKTKSESDLPLLGKAKDTPLVNGLPPGQEEEQSRDDARSPAYSDISDANDTAPLLDAESDTKDIKDEKKPELPMGPNSPYAYSLYYGAYGQPHPYMMPPIQPPSGPITLKQGDLKEKVSEKEKKEPNMNQYPPQYLYSYSHLYPPGYPDPYMRDPIYKDIVEKSKMEHKEGASSGDSENKGPTDLSRSINASSGAEKINLKEGTVPSANKDSYRYLNYLDSRGAPPPVQPNSLLDKQCPDPKKQSPLMSPRLASSPITSKEDKRPSDPKLSEGVKPTMETTGPPPPPTSSAYYPPFPQYPHVPFDPYQASLMPSMSLPGGFPPTYLQGHHPPPGLGGLRYPMGVPSGIPEDLSRSGAGVLHPSGLYGSHKIAELQERAQKSPSNPISSCGLTRVSSPLAKDHLVSSPSIPGGDRKTPPSRLSSHSYPLMPGAAQFTSHFAALGVNPTVASVVGQAAPPAGMLPK